MNTKNGFVKEKQVGNWKVIIRDRGYGFFENQVSGCEGGIWMEGKTVVDYDGVFELPAKVVQALTELGYTFEKNILPTEKE